MNWTNLADQYLLPLGIIAGWFILMRFILPRFGVST
jgi:hypothetical protein